MISIVVPVYNVYPFVKECIESICNQTYKNIEIILVDDGSTDNSGKVCEEYRKDDSRIRVIHQNNQGLSAARNAGIQIANGEFLMFVDSDDRIHPMMVQAMYDAMAQNRAELVICSYRMIQEKESKDSLTQKLTIDEREIEVLSGRECVKRMYSSNQKVDFIVAWNKLYRKSMFSELEYPVGRLHEDEFLTYKILYPLNRCVFLNVPLYEYRFRTGSIMGRKDVKRLQDKIEAFEERCVYFEQRCDTELYYETLRRYETAIAELILLLEKTTEDKELMRNLSNQFRLVYEEKIADSEIEFRHKVKYKVFMINRTIYKILKKMNYKKLKNYNVGERKIT